MQIIILLYISRQLSKLPSVLVVLVVEKGATFFCMEGPNNIEYS